MHPLIVALEAGAFSAVICLGIILSFRRLRINAAAELVKYDLPTLGEILIRFPFFGMDEKTLNKNRTDAWLQSVIKFKCK